jgi:hypothetical protein
VRGGRIPPWTLTTKLTRWLKLPVPLAKMGAHGRLSVRGGICAATDQLPGVSRFAQSIGQRLPAGQRQHVLVGHCDCRDEGERLCAEINKTPVARAAIL